MEGQEIEDYISRFKNGKALYGQSPLFVSVVRALSEGRDPISIIESLIENTERVNRSVLHIESKLSELNRDNSFYCSTLNKLTTEPRQKKSVIQSVLDAQEELRGIHVYNSVMLSGIYAPEQEVDLILNDAKVNGKMEIVSSPKGEANGDKYEFFKEVHVDQYSVGDSGDSYSGAIYAKFGENKWLLIPFEC